ncbi:hypothetical protein O6H91_03G109900 [Diphasiastrum complanatum]|uniref:Uncharacterized protein n=1 Tax=Diphasiastrum complanatum TaxID=34168 RepID=A0ACC2EAW2_DIPCM|nr:hypothetical protein O6H91_03G109900 [Diphasiastrum complanatum]
MVMVLGYLSNLHGERATHCIIVCILSEKEKNNTFSLPGNSDFVRNCYYKGSLLAGLCSQGEIMFYIKWILDVANLPPSPNCNETHWSKGCDAGWASLLVDTSDVNQITSTNASHYIPVRSLHDQPCCEGFFCPKGLNCMMPCPLGAYCPLADFNETTGSCEPYDYQLRPGSDYTCGGANTWSDVATTGQIFCSAGDYCPLPTENHICEAGHYCRAGSTFQRKCYRFSSCGLGSTKQSLLLYGIFFIVVLALLLILLYGCSEQVMSLQERQKSKARERAIQQAKDHVSAVERWRLAKDRAKFHAKSLSATISRNFSGKLESKDEEMRVFPQGQPKSHELIADRTIDEDNATSFTPKALGKSRSVIDEDLYSPLPAPPTVYPIEHGVQFPRPMHMKNTRSQIFKYAYGQIEKEKALYMSDSEPSRAADSIGRSRLPIELVFEDLTMTLKKSRKKILCNVTGKLSPGNITAIMGPSGAGKTTFLNAVAGKTTQSHTSGRVYINGKEGSIQSYRKIIGFVPQDDIVHGSLTVEENLWFSAKYRLPVDMPKRERVLVVERIIATLGLGPIRDSLVGTIEKRGISGGQRKRVNVALEMVMEPSLLILDEPTSGLDSTSSRLVLQALRREAAVGVNVVVVLHQPSYGLFRMFDNVMLLAKGGRTVYLGPVTEVDGYFKSLGYPVPDRVNPPDHFMDVLEGIVAVSGGFNHTHTHLPLLWLETKGYPVPEDLRAEANELHVILGDTISEHKPKNEILMLLHEVWEEFKIQVILRFDAYKNTFSTAHDLSGRRTPGFLRQFKVIIERVTKQRFREARTLAQDYIILLLCGICLGLLSDIKDETLGSNGYSYTLIALSLLCMIAALRTFSLDRLEFWRESASGINRVAYFLAKDTTDHFNTAVKPIVYLCMFYFFNDPRSTFVSNYIVTMALVYCVTGIAYIFAVTLQPATAQLCSVFVPIVATLVATRKNLSSDVLQILVDSSYARWALEGFVVANAERYDGVWLITRCGVLQQWGYRLDHFYFCVALLLAYGAGARIVALLCLMFTHRGRQK